MTAAETTTYDGIPRMPALFGRAASPRQRPDRAGLWPAGDGNTLVTWVAAPADPVALERLLPAGFEVADPLLIVEAISLTGLPWLAGRGYEMLLFSTPVRYRIPDHEPVTGRLELVTWEDSPDAIMTGREELGWNKLYADTMRRQLIDGGRQIRYTAAWGGTTFFELDVKLDPVIPHRARRLIPKVGAWRSGPLMHYRIFPQAGAPGKTAIEEVTAHHAGQPLSAMRSLRTGTGSFRFSSATFEQLPTLQHIVSRLATIDLGDPTDVGQARTAQWADVSDLKIISD